METIHGHGSPGEVIHGANPIVANVYRIDRANHHAFPISGNSL